MKKKARINHVAITISTNYILTHIWYKTSAKSRFKHHDVNPNEIMLYPLKFVQESRSIRHIIQQCVIYKVLPKTVEEWMKKENPYATYEENKINNDIFTMNLIDKIHGNDFVASYGEKINY